MGWPGKNFSLGFLSGALLVGVLACFAVNTYIRFSYALDSLAAFSNTEAAVSTLVESGHLDKAQTKLRVAAFLSQQNGKFYNCLNEHKYHLWFSRAVEDCKHFLKEKMPNDWVDPSKQTFAVDQFGNLISSDPD